MKAIALLFDKNFRPRGTVIFEENQLTDRTDIHVYVGPNKLLKSGLHGFHIHSSGDLSEHCTSLCAHYNPFKDVHGGPRSAHRHLGDLGNVSANRRGVVNQHLSHPYLPLHGKHSIIGRSVIIHDQEDDLGRGGDDESLSTGNAGKRLLCGVIGYKKTCA